MNNHSSTALKHRSIRALILSASVLTLLQPCRELHALTIWDRGAGTGDLNDAVNWVGNVLPPTGDTIQFDNTAAGAQALTFNAAVGSTTGYLMSITAAQTGSLTITNINAASQNFRFLNGNSLTIANASASAFTLGQAGSANAIQMVLGSGNTAANYTFTSGSSAVATIHENVTINRGGDHAATLIFTGSGAGGYDVRGKIGNLSRQAATAATGALNCNVSGTGKVTLFADNTTDPLATWNIFVSRGTLSFSNLNNLGNGTGAIRLGQTTTSGNLEFTGGANTVISRQVTIGNGAAAGDTGSSTVTSSGAGTLSFSNAAFNAPNATATIGRSLTLRGTNTGANTISGVIADNVAGAIVSLLKSDAGTWVLGGANTFSGQVLINEGTLSISAANNLGTSALSLRLGNTSTDGALLYTGASATTITRQMRIGNGNAAGDNGSSTITSNGLGTISFNNAAFNEVATSVAARSLTLRGTSTGNNEISGVIADNNTGLVSLIKRDAGTWNLTGANTFTNGIQVWEGTLEFNSNSALGAQTVQTRIGRTTTTGTLRHTGSSNTIVTGQAQVGFGAGGTGNAVVESSGAGTLSFSNATFNLAEGGANANRTLFLGGTNVNANTISGAIVNNNNASALIGLTKQDAGTWILDAANTYTGATAVNGGTLVLNAAGALTTTSGVTIASGATLQVNTIVGDVIGNSVDVTVATGGTVDLRKNDTIGGLSGGGTITNGAGGSFVLTAGGGDETTTFSGTMNSGSGTLGLAKTGSGTLTLSGANTYTGPTTVSAGTVEVSGSLSGTTQVNVTGGTLLLGASNAINNGAAMNLGGGTFGTGGFSEGSPSTVGLGALTLSANSTLDFGTGTGSQLLFAGVGTHTGGTTLAITNWSGTIGALGGATDDRLMFFGTTTDFTSLYAQNDISFNSVLGYSAIQFDANHFEIVAIPEPGSTTLLGGVAMLGLAFFRETRKRAAGRRLTRIGC